MMFKLAPLLGFVFLLVATILAYIALSAFALGWVVIALLIGMLCGVVFMSWRQANRLEIKLFNEASRCYLAQDYPTALQLCQKVLEHTPNQPQVINLMATCHTNLEQYTEARDCYRRLVELQPRNAAAYSNLASVANRIEPIDTLVVAENLDRAWELMLNRRFDQATYYALLKMAFTELEIERYSEAIRACNAIFEQRSFATSPLLVRGLALLLKDPDDLFYLEQGRADLIEFLRKGFDTEVSLKQEIQFMLKAREFLLETGGLPKDLTPKIINIEK